MTSLMQIRLWLAEAPARERRLAIAAALVAAALVAWALIPPNRGAQESADASVSTGADTVPVGSDGVAGNGLGGDAGTANGSSVSPAGVGGVTGSAGVGSSGPGSVSAQGAVGAPTPRTSGSGGTTPAARPAPLKATDQGVTASSIKLGVTVASIGNLNALGFSPNSRTDIPKVVAALADDVNKHGGVNGRTIDAVTKEVDLVDPNAQRAKCIEFTETDKVFALLDTFNFSASASRSCVSVEHKVPLVTFYTGTTAELAKAAPLQVSSSSDFEQRLRDAVDYYAGTGTFDTAKGYANLGILDDACTTDAIDGAKGLKAALRAKGVTKWSEYRADCDVSQSQQAGAQALLQFRQAGVTHVFIAANSLEWQGFQSAAAAQQWRPKYLVSDYYLATDNSTSSDVYNANQLDGTRAVTQWHLGDIVTQTPVQRCAKVLTDHGLPAITDADRDNEAILICDNFDLFVRAATAAGANLTRPAFGNAAKNVGQLSTGKVIRAVLNGKPTGGDGLAVVEFHKACTCFERIAAYR